MTSPVRRRIALPQDPRGCPISRLTETSKHGKSSIAITDFREVDRLAQMLVSRPIRHVPYASFSLHPSGTAQLAMDIAEERRVRDHDADVVVVGAGILGCAIAVALGKQGRSVLLLEKSLKEPDRIVGELLQPGGVAALDTLGLRDCLEDIDAIRVEGYEVIYYDQRVHIPYPETVKETLRKRPEGRSFHHGRFIQRLRAAARATPNVTVVETTATDLVKSGWTGQVLGVKSTTQGKSDYYFGHLTIIADGYASKFRKEYIKHQPVSRSKFWGLELIDADLPRPEHGHVILGDGAPVLLYQIGTHETRALVDVPENTPSASIKNGGVKGHLRKTVLPSLPPRVQPAFEAALDRGALRSMPNSFLPPSTNKTPGMVLLGDAMNMRHPLTGGGMTVAFNDVVLLSSLLSPTVVPNLADTPRVIRQMSIFHWRRKSLTSVINILAQALYSLFAANDAQLKTLQEGCFRYFQRGGSCIDGPVGLLAGIIRQPLTLFYHFFAVALLSIWLLLSSSLSATRPWRLPVALCGSAAVFYKACLVLFPFIFSELRV
ncbi:MAG: Squalene epoxidase [Thelocarpon superellum]|nr:MAG: Squalene epoxidase [Thelocarpon superellum]